MNIVFLPAPGLRISKDATGSSFSVEGGGGNSPPPGFSPVPQSKRGAWHKRDGDGWVYWTPGEGVSSSPKEEDETEGRAAAVEGFSQGRQSAAEEEVVPRAPSQEIEGGAEKAVDTVSSPQGQQEIAQVLRGMQGDPSEPGYQEKVEQEILARNSTAHQEWRNAKLAFFSVVSAVSKMGQGTAWLAGGGKENPISQRFQAWSDRAMEGLSPEEKVVGASCAADWAWWGLPLAVGGATGVGAIKALSYGTIFKAIVGGVVGAAGLTGFAVPVIGASVATVAGLTWYAGINSAFYNNVVKRAAHAIGQRIYDGQLDMDMLEKMHGLQYGEEYTPEQSARMYTKAMLALLLDMQKSEGFDLIKSMEDAEDPISSDPQMQQMMASLIAELHTGAMQDTLAELDAGKIDLGEDQTAYLKIIAKQMEKAGLTGEGSEDISEDTWAVFFDNPFAEHGDKPSEEKGSLQDKEEDKTEDKEEPLERSFGLRINRVGG